MPLVYHRWSIWWWLRPGIRIYFVLVASLLFRVLLDQWLLSFTSLMFYSRFFVSFRKKVFWKNYYTWIFPAFGRKGTYGLWFCSATENVRAGTVGILEKSNSWICKWNAGLQNLGKFYCDFIWLCWNSPTKNRNFARVFSTISSTTTVWYLSAQEADCC
jgi:hypothetical protein